MLRIMLYNLSCVEDELTALKKKYKLERQQLKEQIQTPPQSASTDRKKDSYALRYTELLSRG